MFGSDSPIIADFLMLSFSQDLILSDLEVLEWQAYFVEAIGCYQVVTSAPSEVSNMVALVVVPGLALLARCLQMAFCVVSCPATRRYHRSAQLRLD